MVVVSGNWVKNVTAYRCPTINTNAVKGTHNMAPAMAILSMRPNSHDFSERTLTLDQPVKVGRSVARAKATPQNAIFDCKVLSRHHALLWYEDGKFFLQDTKSSNGTFVNNNKLQSETENHELCSGDIVQFGVDVVENNRKITHGCIIATIRLYMPDGKEAKASPSLTEEERKSQEMVPLDDLYRLNQIIQEASEREYCLETKLTALQNAVDETRRSAEESWQVYVGEERLLSRVSVLETQLQHASRNWGEDRLREELSKLQEDNEAYQTAAKEALEKLHAEKLQAVALAVEQERARQAAEQEAQIATEQYQQIHVELELIARRLMEQNKTFKEQEKKLEKQEQELKSKLQCETAKVLELQMKLSDLNALSIEDFHNLGRIDDSREKPNLIYDDDLKCKEDMLAENEVCDSLNRTNGSHINLTVAPVDESTSETESNLSAELDSPPKSEQEHAKKVTFQVNNDLGHAGNDTAGSSQSVSNIGPPSSPRRYRALCVATACALEFPQKRNILRWDGPILKMQNDSAGGCFQILNQDESQSEPEDIENNKEVNEKSDDDLCDNVDSKTLKYQFQSAQNELKRKIDLLQSTSNANKAKLTELMKTLEEEKDISQRRLEENEKLKEDLLLMQQKLKESANENQQYKDKMETLGKKLETVQNNLRTPAKDGETQEDTRTNTEIVSPDQLLCLEEELVLLKERFAQVSEEKLKLGKDMLVLREQYNLVCNRSHNKYFFYVAPLIAMVLYLLVSAMIS